MPLLTQQTTAKLIAVEDWRLLALEKRRQGKQFRQIAAELGAMGGPSTVSRAYTLVVEGLADLREQCREAAQDVRDIEIQRCDGMIEVLWSRLHALDGGKAISARTSARLVDSILRVQDRKARFLGLDAPKRIEATGAAGAPLLPPASIAIQLVAPGQAVPPPAPIEAPPTEVPSE